MVPTTKITIYGWSASEAPPQTAQKGWLSWCYRGGLAHDRLLSVEVGGGHGPPSGDGQRRPRRTPGIDIQCLDRIYLNAYIPRLQTSAQVVAFLSGHLGYPFPSPALFNQLGRRFRRAVAAYAQANDLPWVQFAKDDDKLAVMGAHLDHQAATGTSGVAAIGVAQEFQRVWTATEGKTTTGTPRWSFYKADRRVTCSYLLPVGRRLRPRLRQGVCLVPVSGQGLAQRPRVGQTPSPPRPASASPSSPTGSPPARIHKRCSASATGSVPAPSAWSFSAGWLGCPYR
jgi:hypothetical protein